MVHAVSRWYESFSISFTDKMQRIGETHAPYTIIVTCMQHVHMANLKEQLKCRWVKT